MKEKKKKGFKLPDTYVLVAIMLIVMAALTYIVPAGTYDMVTSEATGKQVVDRSFIFRVGAFFITL